MAAPEHEDLGLLDAYWRAANFLSVGQIYQLDHPLPRESLRSEHVKPRLVSTDDAAVRTLVVAVREDLEMARPARALLGAAG